MQAGVIVVNKPMNRATERTLLIDVIGDFMFHSLFEDSDVNTKIKNHASHGDVNLCGLGKYDFPLNKRKCGSRYGFACAQHIAEGSN